MKTWIVHLRIFPSWKNRVLAPNGRSDTPMLFRYFIDHEVFSTSASNLPRFADARLNENDEYLAKILAPEGDNDHSK